jgi:hypothetical protein
MDRRFTVIAAILFSITGCIQANGSPCTALDGADPQTLIEYLESSRNMQAPDCMTYAIDKLGQQQRAEASSVLTAYLDFQRPGTEPDPHKPLITRDPISMGDIYPAIDALFKIGMPAVPSLVHRIGDRETTRPRPKARTICLGRSSSRPSLGGDLVTEARE